MNRLGPVPIPPGSVVRLAHADKETPEWRREQGRVFRVGYYSRADGLDCVWLVNDDGVYEQATDHEFLYRYFDIIQLGETANWYGRKKPQMLPIRRAITRAPQRQGYRPREQRKA